MLISMQTRLATLLRGMLMAGVAAASLSSPAAAQGSPEARDTLFLELTQLQDANLGTARQMSEIQRRAATALETVLAAGQVADPAQREVVEAFIANALTLASVALAPVATRDVATADVFSVLVAENMKLIERAEPLFRQSPDLAAAMEQYAVMQLQTQDLGLELHNGWTRYGQAIANAEAASLLPPGAFDPSTRSWTITLPEVVLADAGAAPQSTETPAAEARLTPDGAVKATVAAASEPAAEAAEQVVGSAGEPAPPVTGSLALVDPAAAVPQAAGWMVMIGDNARAVAIAPNSNATTAGRIRGMQIGCHPNGTLRYIFETDEDIEEYLVFANQTQSATIRAKSNVISGGQAIRMSDVLRLAFEWATANSPGGRLTIAAGDTPDDLATFPVAGYLEARGRVLDGCVPWEDDSQPQEDVPIAGSAQVEGEIPLELTTGQPIPATDSVAPIPHPRPADRMPVDLMTAG